MRLILGGLFALFMFVSSAVAQVTGQVESIGFAGEYRPGCWTPMLVKLQSSGAPSDFYEVRIWQHDLDGDLPYYATRISLTAAAGPQTFWTYFIPEPIHGGLTVGATTSAELAQRLRVTIHDKTGKELAQIPLGTATATAVDDIDSRDARASRLVLFVGEGAPPLAQFDPAGILGIKEDLTSARVPLDRLPESPIGYDGVDAIVWLDGDPAKLSEGNSRRMQTLHEFVRRGGHLVICTPANWQILNAFDDLMPVDIRGVESNKLQSPVRELANRAPYQATGRGTYTNPWERFKNPLTIATATPRKDAVVEISADRVEDPQKPEDSTPWLVRMPYGYGVVTWVGQDMGDRTLTNQLNWGWPAVWDEILGAESSPVINAANNRDKARVEAGGVLEMGSTVLSSMNLEGRGAKLVGITVLFFVCYWLIAGPGAFFWLRYKQRSGLNWFVFGALALGATALTLGIVKLVLRGDPEVVHLSFIRADSERGAATIRSRIGMYVPRDGAQQIEVAPPESRALIAPTLTPFPIHPFLHRSHSGDNYLVAAPRTYRVEAPTGDADDKPAASAVPFRTTMKRLEATWSGPLDDRIEGRPALTLSSANVGFIKGTLTNLTGKDLRNIWISFRHQQPGGLPAYYLMFVPEWKSTGKLDLGAAFNPPAGKSSLDITVNADKQIGPNRDFPVRGQFRDWSDIFNPVMRARNTMGGATEADDFGNAIPLSVPMLSFFNMIPAPTNPQDGAGNYTRSLANVRRAGLREWDASGAVQAGRLVIVAQADDTPLPLPMTVEGLKMTGKGKTIYQFFVPLEPIPQPPANVTAVTTQTTSPPTTRPN